MLIGIFTFLLSCLAFSQTYKVSQLKFENFKTYEQYDIELDTVRAVLLQFSQEYPSFEQSGLFVLAGRLASLYHDRGLVFHRVEVKLGNPTRLVLVPGIMSAVDIRGNRRYRTEQLSPFFDDLFGTLVDSQSMQNAMLQMNALPGVNGFAYLSFGSAPGDAVMNVSVNEERWGQLSTRINNHGAETTGEYRLVSQLTLNNPLHLSEQWRLSGSVNDQLENWSAGLGVDFYRGARHRFSLNTSLQHLAVSQSLSLLDMSGWQGSAELGYRYQPSQRFNQTFVLEPAIGFVQQSLTNAANIDALDIAFQDIPVDLKISGDRASAKQFLGYELTGSGGWLLSYQAPLLLEESYWARLQPAISYALSVTGGALQRGIDIKSQISGQYALTELPSHRRFALTGPTKVASRLPGQGSYDTGLFAELGLSLFNVQWGPLHSAFQVNSQVGWGMTGESQSDALVGLGGILDVDIGPVKTQNKLFTDESFSSLVWWFDVTLDWPKGK